MRGLAALVLAVLIGTPAVLPAGPTPLQVQMRNIALHVDGTTIVNIVHLRGELVSTSSTRPPVFDDRNSFKVRVDSAEISLDAKALTQLLNRYTFAYQDSPLRDVEVTTEDRALKVSGELRKGIPVPFSMTAEPSVAGGQLKLHPTKIKTLGIPTQRLMTLFGLELDNIIKLREDRGARIDGDDLLLNPGALLPPPAIEGRLQSVQVEGDRIVQRYGPGASAGAEAARSVGPQLHVLLERRAQVRQADHDRHRHAADRRESARPVRLLSGALQRSAGRRLFEEHCCAWAEGLHARLSRGGSE